MCLHVDIPLSDMRRLIEMAYLHAWVYDTSYGMAIRDEFRRMWDNVKGTGIGTFTYDGNDVFTWTDAE